ncbi:MAG: cell division protein SepF [Firmicutes bacterium]|jgi:cell division inhibitor SepF|nr:cell division protein SepF [Bacillota bacterium]
MAANLVGKFLNLMGFEETVVEEVVAEEEEVQLAPTKRERGRAKVVGLPSAPSGSKVVIVQPESFEAAQAIADHLKSRRTVVVNLEGMDEVTSQRIVDFVSGAAFALNGSVERVGDEIFLFAPSNVDIVAQHKEPEAAAFPWLR